MADIVQFGKFEIEVGSPVYERLLKQGKITERATGGTVETPVADKALADLGRRALADLGRRALDEIAADLGIAEPGKLPNKAALVAAIEAARAAIAAAGGNSESGETLNT